MQDHADTVNRIKNYVFGAGGITLSLADITGVFQCIAAIGGAILVCRQLWRDYKREQDSKKD